MENYNPLVIENKWQSFFEKNQIFKTKKNSDKKFYCLRNVSLSIWKYSYGSC